jgi:hypothetical protein
MSSRAPWWVWAIGIGGVGYVLYKLWGGFAQTANTATNAVSSAIANIWLSLPLVGLPANMQVLGNVKLPDGTLVPLNSLSSGQIRQQGSTVLANVSGTIYQLAPSDSQGNYPATSVGAAPAGS